MASVDNDKFYFDRKNYFIRFVSNEHKIDKPTNDSQSKSIVNQTSRSIRHALEYFVDDLRRDRDKTIQRFLSEQNVNDIFRSIAQLLLSNDDRICGNSAYILGSTVELESGLKRFLTIFSNAHTSDNVDVVHILCHLLTHPDPECVLNAAGTLGTICSSREGRDLIIQHTCIAQMIINTSHLLSSTNAWIASNAGLVLARITVEDVGCQTILTHSKHNEILNQLVAALDISDPSRSTNAAFAIGRLIEGDDGKKILVADCGQYRIFDALLIMLEGTEEKGVNKNACYALSCLCTTQYGFQLCLQYITNFHRILKAIEKTLLSVEHETVWFALMCLRTIGQYDGAHEHLNQSKTLANKLKILREKWITYKDIQEETKLLWYMMHRHIKPDPPKINECQTNSADISWEISKHCWDIDELQFRIIVDDQPMGMTNKNAYSLKDLKPNTKYNVQIQYITSLGESVRSDAAILHTDDELPPPVSNIRVERKTMTAARIAWDQPDLNSCNSFKGYQVYLNDAEHEITTETSITIGSLIASTMYQIDVCAITNKGKGPRATIDVITASAGDSYPAPPTFSVIGRREMHIKWQAPDVISGRLTRYELLCNRRCIYSGIDQEYHATMLKSDTEYTMEVIVITNEGRFRSRPSKARTLKDEFSNSHRHSLYESSSQNSPKLKRVETNPALSSSGTKNGTAKSAPMHERQIFREGTISSRHTENTQIRPLQFKVKSENIMNTRILPPVVKGAHSRLTGINRSRNNQRPRTDPATINQTLPQTQVRASIIIPTLAVDNGPQMSWATPISRRQIPSSGFRISALQKSSSIIPNKTRIERAPSTSLPDLPLKQQ